MRWKLIPVFRDGQAHGCPYPYLLALIREPSDDSDLRPAVLEATGWCTEQFGNDYRRWRAETGFDFAFRDHADAVAFKMRWG